MGVQWAEWRADRARGAGCAGPRPNWASTATSRPRSSAGAGLPSCTGPTSWRAGALDTAHRLGGLHREIKPETVLMSNFGEPKLADFGIAHVVGGTSQTRSGPVALSVLHAPPEVFDGKPAGTASDVYSL